MSVLKDSPRFLAGLIKIAGIVQLFIGLVALYYGPMEIYASISSQKKVRFIIPDSE